VSTIRSLRRAAESVIHSDPTRRDDHCSWAHPGYVMAHLQTSRPPPAIDHRSCELGGSRPPRGVSPATGAFPATADAAAARLLDHTAASGCAQALSRTAISRRRQTAACFREAGILLNGLPGGGAESVDRTPSGRRVLHAQQMPLGMRAACLVGPSTAPPPYPSPAPHARTQGPPDGVQQPSPYGVAQRSKQRSGGAGSSGYRAEMLLALREQSESLCTPYCSGLLGSFLLQGTTVCRSRLICSVRSAPRFGCTTVTMPLNARLTPPETAEPPPGRTMDQLGAVVKDPAAWTGQTSPTRRGPSTAASWAERHTRGAPPGDALAEATRRTGMSEADVLDLVLARSA
jgi:hypothetical protein